MSKKQKTSTSEVEKRNVTSSVTYIGESAFLNNTIKSVKIPASVTELADDAFDRNIEIIREGVAMTESPNSLQLKL